MPCVRWTRSFKAPWTRLVSGRFTNTVTPLCDHLWDLRRISDDVAYGHPVSGTRLGETTPVFAHQLERVGIAVQDRGTYPQLQRQVPFTEDGAVDARYRKHVVQLFEGRQLLDQDQHECLVVDLFG